MRSILSLTAVRRGWTMTGSVYHGCQILRASTAASQPRQWRVRFWFVVRHFENRMAGIQGTATRALVRMSGGSPEYQVFLGKRGNMEAKKGESWRRETPDTDAFTSLRGRRSKGKGKGIRARDHARGRREEGNACKEAIVFAIPPTN